MSMIFLTYRMKNRIVLTESPNDTKVYGVWQFQVISYPLNRLKPSTIVICQLQIGPRYKLLLISGKSRHATLKNSGHLTEWQQFRHEFCGQKWLPGCAQWTCVPLAVLVYLVPHCKKPAPMVGDCPPMTWTYVTARIAHRWRFSRQRLSQVEGRRKSARLCTLDILGSLCIGGP